MREELILGESYCWRHPYVYEADDPEQGLNKDVADFEDANFVAVVGKKLDSCTGRLFGGNPQRNVEVLAAKDIVEFVDGVAEVVSRRSLGPAREGEGEGVRVEGAVGLVVVGSGVEGEDPRVGIERVGSQGGRGDEAEAGGEAEGADQQSEGYSRGRSKR